MAGSNALRSTASPLVSLVSHHTLNGTTDPGFPRFWFPGFGAFRSDCRKRRTSVVGMPPGFRLHRSKGDLAGPMECARFWSWRVVFRLEDGEAMDVDMVDYHRTKGGKDMTEKRRTSRRDA